MSDRSTIWAYGGDTVRAPENTLPAFWGALGAGAGGLAVPLRRTADDRLVAVRDLPASTGSSEPVSRLTFRQIRQLDAGARYRRRYLDDQHRSTGEAGDTTPWKGHDGKYDALYHPELDELLRLFGRRCPLMLWPQVDDGEDLAELIGLLLAKLDSFGLRRRVIVAGPREVVEQVRQSGPDGAVALAADGGETAADLAPDWLIVPAERLVRDELLRQDGPPVWAISDTAPSPRAFAALAEAPRCAGFVVGAAAEVVTMKYPASVVAADSFHGDDLDRDLWVTGRSKDNDDTEYGQRDGTFVIDIRAGGEYSGAALLTAYPIHGDFDAQVGFHVTNPTQGTTFELAAIEVDPGYFGKVNLTFDVHGAPPYASSERDEDDGFRIGWNNGPALIKNVQIGDQPWDTEAQSDNEYNKYSRDVGDGSKDNPTGRLRLVRRGSLFTSYYTDGHHHDWVLSGYALVPTLAEDVFLRLGAKHWPKRGKTPPHNRIEFSDFVLYQY